MVDPIGSCWGKMQYASGHTAAKAMKRLGRRRNAGKHNGLKPYKCKACPHWHIGTPPRTSGKALQKMRRRFERDHPEMVR